MNARTFVALRDELQKLASSRIPPVFCSTCKKEHRPICDRCGKTDGDFRSLHGPCGRCVFPNGVGKKKTAAAGPGLPVNTPGWFTSVAAPGRWAQGRIEATGEAIKDMAHPVKNFPRGGRAFLKSFTPGGKMGLPMALLQAHGMYTLGREAFQDVDPTGQGRSKVERLSELAGDQVGNIIGWKHGVIPSIVTGSIGRKAGKLIGKGVDWARGYRPDPRHLQQLPEGY